MYIEPDSIIRIFKNVPLDAGHQHTLRFSSLTNQNAYFNGAKTYEFTDQYYQRVERGKMRVEKEAKYLYDCGYLAFQNTGFGSKWFYAFITGVEYINNTTTELTFEIDPMQTYLFDVELGQCFVEREHSATDTIGDNLVPEKVELGDYIIHTQSMYGYTSGYGTAGYAIFGPFYKNNSGVPIDTDTGEYRGGLYTGIHATVFSALEASNGDIDTFLSALAQAGKLDAVVGTSIVPIHFLGTAGSGTPVTETITRPKIYTNTYDSTWQPKNNKLYTYPYNFLEVSNAQGDTQQFHYEHFSTADCTFDMSGIVDIDSELLLVPKSYLITGNLPVNNLQYSLSISGYPMFSLNGDSVKNWISNTGVAWGIKSVGSGLGAVASVALSGGNVGDYTASNLGQNLVGNVTNKLAEAQQRSITPREIIGKSTPSIAAISGRLDFHFYPKHIRKEYAQIIDEYFTMYGYACHRVKVPNVAVGTGLGGNRRPKWNYVKTVGCVFSKTNCPADAERELAKIYDNGITFWENASEVGNYTLNNAPT